MIDEATRSYVRSIIEDTPNRIGNIDSVKLRGRKRRRTTHLGVIASAAAVALIVAGSMVWWRSPERPVASGDQTIALELPGGFVVTVAADPVESEGALVYLGLLGPMPAFDTAGLGTEITLSLGETSDLIVPPSNNSLEGNALQAPTMVYLGDINGAQIALQVAEGGIFGIGGVDQLCVFFGNGTPVTGGGDCYVEGGPISGFANDPAIGGWLVWTHVPEGTAAVLMRLRDGSSYWQRPAARTVFFNLPDGRALEDPQLSALDANGELLAGPLSTRGDQPDWSLYPRERLGDPTWAEIALLDGRLTVFGNADASSLDLENAAAMVCSTGVDVGPSAPVDKPLDLRALAPLLSEFGCDVTTFSITIDHGAVEVIVAAEQQETVDRLQKYLDDNGFAGRAELDFSGMSPLPAG